MWCAFKVEYGVEVPVLGLDLKQPDSPFVPITTFTPTKVDCPPQVCDSKDPYPPPPNMGAWSCDQDMLGHQTCDDLDDLTQMILPLNAECCDEPDEECSEGELSMHSA